MTAPCISWTDSGVAHLSELKVDGFGAVENWPPNFFGDSVGEARAQAQARAKRMHGGRNA